MAVYGFDLETNQLSPFVGDPLILTAAVHGKNGSIGAMVDHPLGPGRDQKAIDQICDILEDPDNVIVGHRIVVFDIPMWEKLTGRRVLARWFDTHVAYNLIDENSSLTKSNTLEFLAAKYTSQRKNEDGLDRRKLAQAPADLVLKYNVSDARISYALYAPMLADLKAEDLVPLMEFQMWVGRSLTDATLTGMWADLEWAREQSLAITTELAEVKADLLETIGIDINLGSPKQLGELLYGFFRMPVVERTKTGAPSTSEAALKELRSIATLPIAQEFLDKLLKYRELAKLVGTYLEPLTTEHRGHDGRIHTTFNLAGTVTGRLSSATPNLQNLPRDKRVKGVLAATPGMRIFNADYSQLELRVAAWYSGEPSMLRAFAEGLDVHTLTLAEMEGKDYDLVSELIERYKEWEEKRALIKRVNFGVLYGVGPHRLVQLMRDMGIHITFRQAERIIAQWFERRAVMVQWIERTQEEIVDQGYVLMPTGRKRRLPGINPDTPSGQRALRQGVNARVQSLAGEIGKCAFALVGNYFEDVGGARVLVPVHDSVVGEYIPEDWPEADLKETVENLMVKQTLREMNARFGLGTDIPLAIDVKLGSERWA